MTPTELNGAAQATATLRQETSQVMSNMEIRHAARAAEAEKAALRKHERYGKTTIKAIGDAFVVRPIEIKDTNEAGLALPDKVLADMKRSRGIVLAIGPGPMVIDGCIVPMPQVDVGDEVVYNARMLSKPDGDEGYEFHIVPAKNICGVIVRGQ